MKILHMIGNSHIDPVWFWDKAEGMQAVKSTFQSALDRIREYPEFTFTASSACFYRWIEQIDGEMLEEIKTRVKEKRWHFTGGWLVEADCNLPTGESFARQALYGQQYFHDIFGEAAKIGFSVDSFGHNNNLPQLLLQSGMEYYVYMRPERADLPPVFRWQSPDGSEIVVSKVPGEYTAWFEANTRANVDASLEAANEHGQSLCFFGVGNHGGGPTIENIESILRLREELKDQALLQFSSPEAFFETLDPNVLPVWRGELQKTNTGCYSVQSRIKRMNRLAESRAVRAERWNAAAKLYSGRKVAETEEFADIWREICFQQFHDILPGTSIKSASEQALMALGKAVTLSQDIESLAIQYIACTVDTRGEGFPLFLFNPHSHPFKGCVEVELEWFCKDELIILDPCGNNVAYQRVRTATPTIHMNLAGRRRVIFCAEIPPCGFSVYRLCKTGRTIAEVNYIPSKVQKDNLLMENTHIRCEISPQSGLPCSLVSKTAGYDLLSGSGMHRVFKDHRDTWGGGEGELAFHGDSMQLVSVERVESGDLRTVIRSVFHYQNSELVQLYILSDESPFLEIRNHLRWNEPHTRLKQTWNLNVESPQVKVETPYSHIVRSSKEEEDSWMQRWVDISECGGHGGLFANDGLYSYGIDGSVFDLVILRSAIYAQGTTSANWFREEDTYFHTDMGEHDFTVIVSPHSDTMKTSQAHRLADCLNMPYSYLADSHHPGREKADKLSFLSVDQENILLTVMKESEKEEALVLRLQETDGTETEATLTLWNCPCPIALKFLPYEVQTIKIDPESGDYRTCNFLEFTVSY